MARTTKCSHCKEITFSRFDVVNGRLCNLCDGPKPMRAATATHTTKIAEREALISRLLGE